jgi:hypothetical protein
LVDVQPITPSLSSFYDGNEGSGDASRKVSWSQTNIRKFPNMEETKDDPRVSLERRLSLRSQVIFTFFDSMPSSHSLFQYSACHCKMLFKLLSTALQKEFGALRSFPWDLSSCHLCFVLKLPGDHLEKLETVFWQLHLLSEVMFCFVFLRIMAF